MLHITFIPGMLQSRIVLQRLLSPFVNLNQVLLFERQ